MRDKYEKIRIRDDETHEEWKARVLKMFDEPYVIGAVVGILTISLLALAGFGIFRSNIAIDDYKPTQPPQSNHTIDLDSPVPEYGRSNITYDTNLDIDMGDLYDNLDADMGAVQDVWDNKVNETANGGGGGTE